MAKTKTKKLRRLTRINGTRRKHATLGCFQWQKDALMRRAARRGMTVSYYLNFLLWSDWLERTEK